VTEAVLDSSVVLKWFDEHRSRHLEHALELLGRFEGGRLRVLAPTLLMLETINVAARQWRWSEEALLRFEKRLSTLGFELKEPEPEEVARWAAAGLTAYDAAYVAVAEQAGVPLITDDEEIVARAPGVAEALSYVSGDR
jgi:predicted nucleic acid-binding protein